MWLVGIEWTQFLTVASSRCPGDCDQLNRAKSKADCIGAHERFRLATRENESERDNSSSRRQCTAIILFRRRERDRERKSREKKSRQIRAMHVQYCTLAALSLSLSLSHYKLYLFVCALQTALGSMDLELALSYPTLLTLVFYLI